MGDRSPRKEHWLALVGLVLGWAALGLARTGFQVAADSIWAEDGAVFLRDARDRPWSVFEPYRGYLHVVPRLLASVAAQVPLEAAPILLSGFGALGMACCALVVYLSTAAHVASRAVRLSLASYLVLLPVFGTEVPNNISYLQWPLTIAAAWALLAPTASWTAPLMAITALTAPQSLVLLPLALARGLGGARAPLAALLAGLAVQYGVTLTLAAGEPGLSLDLAGLFLQRVMGGLLLGDRLNEFAWLHVPRVVYYGAASLALAATAFVFVLWWRIEARRAFPAIALAVTGLGVFVFSVVARNDTWTPPAWTPGFAMSAGARYFVVPAFLLASAVALLVDRLRQADADLAWPGLAVAALVVVASCATSFDTPRDPRAETSWGEELEAAVDRCEAGADIVRVKIAPASRAWAVPILCEDLPGRLAEP